MNGENEGLMAPAPKAPALEQAQLEEQIAALEEELTGHRKKMVVAKKTHESNMDRALELRKTLAALERKNMASDFESMMDKEHQIMNRIQGLQVQLSSISSKVKGGK